MNCKNCGTELKHVFLDLGFAPPSNAYLNESDLIKPEKYFPLRVLVCDSCWLVQTEDYINRDELFCSDYAYFSSTSKTWLEHAQKFSRMIIDRLELGSDSLVVEIASNDGYLLRNFVEEQIPCLGIEPADETADEAVKLGISVIKQFFSKELAESLAEQGKAADLIIGNNVYAHVPDINDFTQGLNKLLKPDGTITLEFPHLLKIIEYNQFDTIYHEHYSYLSLTIVNDIFQKNGLKVYDVEELPTHGGSLRVYGSHVNSKRIISISVQKILEREKTAGLSNMDTYLNFQRVVDEIKNNFVEFLIKQKRKGKRIAAYGAAAKGNTLLNYAGIKPDLLPFVYDAAPSKQGKYLPGSHIPILHPDVLLEYKPDYVCIFPWNIKEEIMEQIRYIRVWGGRFITLIPELEVAKGNVVNENIYE